MKRMFFMFFVCFSIISCSVSAMEDESGSKKRNYDAAFGDSHVQQEQKRLKSEVYGHIVEIKRGAVPSLMQETMFSITQMHCCQLGMPNVALVLDQTRQQAKARREQVINIQNHRWTRGSNATRKLILPSSSSSTSTSSSSE